MKNMIIQYNVEKFGEKELHITCGSKTLLSKVLEQFKSDNIGQIRMISKFLDSLELTEEEKETINFDNNNYNVKLDITNKEKHNPIVITEEIAKIATELLNGIAVPIETTLNFSFVNDFIENGIIKIGQPLFKEAVEVDGKHEAVDLELPKDLSLDGFILPTPNTDDYFHLSNVIMNVTSQIENDSVSLNSILKSYYTTTLVKKAVDGDIDSLLLVRQIFELFYNDSVVINVAESRVIDKYLEYKF